MAGGLKLVESTPRAQRLTRSPKHSFQLRTNPFQIAPFMIAPVLPGETLKSGMFQSRVVTDPIKNPLIGWWKEYYFFYVPHPAMPNAAKWQAMVMDPDWEAEANSAETATANVLNYFSGSEIDWVQECLQAILRDDMGWFRTEGEAWDVATINSLPAARVMTDSWLDSVINNDDMPEIEISDGTDPTMMTDLEKLRLRWEALVAMGMSQATYEDFLATYGVHLNKAEDPTRPELLRYSKNWQYPSNTIDPADGSPSSAVSWAISDRLDKDRFFKWPGFIFGVTVSRPKVYMSKQKGNASELLDNAMAWLPAILRSEFAYSLKEVVNTDGPLKGNVTDDSYWVDMVDLFQYGDQFINFALTETNAGLVALPTAAMQKKYPAVGDVDALFVGATDAVQQVREDGVMQMAISSALVDRT